jgi:hypothetical protein
LDRAPVEPEFKFPEIPQHALPPERPAFFDHPDRQTIAVMFLKRQASFSRMESRSDISSQIFRDIRLESEWTPGSLYGLVFLLDVVLFAWSGSARHEEVKGT